MAKDWTGNSNSIWKTLGASNHTDKERQKEDFYATDGVAIDKLRSSYDIPKRVWECSCGEGHLSKRLSAFGHQVYSSDLIDRGYGVTGRDFLMEQSFPWVGYDLDDCCILTNPPFKPSVDFIEHALRIAPYDHTPIIMLMKTTALEGKGRWERLYSKGYLHAIYQFRERLLCAKNGDFEGMRAGGGSAVAYAFYVFMRKRCDAPKIYWI